ncbi:type IV toxin-antitoxin system AbiEi family antitoxin domain-containing protein [Paenibacillus pabuli]|uniref:type IV toxin-antitoxin system AbiEi family antitoxin domain-containing protein n=1 Tax=Paenibacillus pabuli TaxID=1472 RepID=UPI003242379F
MTNNYFTYNQLKDRGMSKIDIERSVAEGVYESLGKGIYVDLKFEHACFLPDATYLFKDGIYCLITALDIHGMTLRMPAYYDVASSRNTRDFSNSINTYHLHKFTGFGYKLGVETKIYGGEPVFVYDIEKTICDVILHKDIMNPEDIQYCIDEYRRDRDDFTKLKSYAQILGIADEVGAYL